jgi:hypothetical protein
MSISRVDKNKILKEFVDAKRYLPPQGSKKWLADRVHTIGGSEMSTITGHNPYKNLRGLIENHLGITVFNGNINTYWGTILEDLVTKILEKLLNTTIYETGSLRGQVCDQKYSPDGLMYLEHLDKIILIEIKSAARRIANGKVPRMYLPQVFTGLDTIQIADYAMFIDAMFRRCAIPNFKFNNVHDRTMHNKQAKGEPQALCGVGFYEKLYSTDYDTVKMKYDVMSPTKWVDLGACDTSDLELVMRDATPGYRRLSVFFTSVQIEDTKEPDKNYYDLCKTEFTDFCKTNSNYPVGFMPLKLFRLDMVPVYRSEWKSFLTPSHTKELRSNIAKETAFLDEVMSDDTMVSETVSDDDDPGGCVTKDETLFVREYEARIKFALDTIKRLYDLPKNEQIEELDKIWEPYRPVIKVDKALEDDLVASMMAL